MLINFCCEQLWLISSHDYRNALHARETNYETRFFKNNEDILHVILLLILHNFSVSYNNTINQNNDLKIATFCWHIL
jgi:hypothetical protein